MVGRHCCKTASAWSSSGGGGFLTVGFLFFGIVRWGKAGGAVGAVGVWVLVWRGWVDVFGTVLSPKKESPPLADVPT